MISDDTDDDFWQNDEDIAVTSSRTRAYIPPRKVSVDLTAAMDAIVPDLVSIEPAFGDIPTIMIASNETADTSSVAVALGAALAALDYRVLLVGAGGTAESLADYVDDDAEPMLVDLFGDLRVVLPSEMDSRVCLAPSLPNGIRFASDLARRHGTPIMDDVGAEFDILIVDGGRAAESVDAGWGADAFVRVGRVDLRRHDDIFTSTFGIPTSGLLGTVVGDHFAPREQMSSQIQRQPLSYETPSARWHRPVPRARPAAMPDGLPRRRVMGR